MKAIIDPMRTGLGILILALGALIVAPVLAGAGLVACVWLFTLAGWTVAGAFVGAILAAMIYGLTLGVFIDWSTQV